MSNITKLKASAIFVDLENIALASDRKGVRFNLLPIMAHISEISSPVLRKAYGDWGRFAKYRNDFIDKAFDLVQVFGNGVSGKNGVDIQMSVDAIETIFFFPHITTIFLVTGDSDYCPLVRMLRKHERSIIGISWLECTSKIFREKRCLHSKLGR